MICTSMDASPKKGLSRKTCLLPHRKKIILTVVGKAQKISSNCDGASGATTNQMQLTRFKP